MLIMNTLLAYYTLFSIIYNIVLSLNDRNYYYTNDISNNYEFTLESSYEKINSIPESNIPKIRTKRIKRNNKITDEDNQCLNGITSDAQLPGVFYKVDINTYYLYKELYHIVYVLVHNMVVLGF